MAEVLQKLSVKRFTATSCNRPGTPREHGAAQISPSTVNGSNRAVIPDSSCDRTSSNACWYEMTAATTATATTASVVVIRMSRPVTGPAPRASR